MMRYTPVRPISARPALALAVALAVAPRPSAAADPTVPVRVRIIKGSRQGPAAVDPRLADLAGQLGKISFTRWDEVGEHRRQMAFRRAEEFPLPDGTQLRLVLLDARRDTVTFEVRVPARRATSRLTIGKDQRIVHQLTDERNGEAFFATVRPWP